ncbi:NAD(P)/FAD-dependent oxidoreductase [Neolewinella lacunae]|uniref:Ferredoxin--NADP reductase n=1 Tax=Neolewinella lacunae TaxID=1517758 RepID=A0A923PLD5_9BACT|nr:NAD(P)/FAD-dependent oxidoreductase [Neolewinella lacunae]MBC6994851.1 NAD(P)/FAD-dependent oxidoreductase [Neolewinella lacunae]MDN3636771.1 NAD(P)/FAD-dependent oxidoreductase [Neolewinella lacunae]
MIQTDILIIGAGPVGLFTVFEAGLLKLRCHLIDSLGQPGGQLTEIYPKKPIYDIPGYPSVLAGELVDNLMEQIAPFNPGFTLGERAETIEKVGEKMYQITTSKGTVHQAPVIMIAGGLGCFEPRKPPIPNINDYEDRGVAYVIRDPEVYRNRRVLLAGGGDSALDWTIFLADVASEVILVHRRDSFRGALDSVEKVMELAEAGRIKLVTNAEVRGIKGEGKVTALTVKIEDTETDIAVDDFIPLFGLAPKLGPIAEWGLQIDKNAIVVDTRDYSTGVDGIYAIGDINTYPGKLKLILCGFHEGTMAVQSAFSYIYPDKKLSFKYTTVNGIEGLPKEATAELAQ